MTELAQEFSKLIFAVGSYLGRPIIRAAETGDESEVLPEETEQLRQAMLRAITAMGTMQEYQQKGQPQ